MHKSILVPEKTIAPEGRVGANLAGADVRLIKGYVQMFTFAMCKLFGETTLKVLQRFTQIN